MSPWAGCGCATGRPTGRGIYLHVADGVGSGGSSLAGALALTIDGAEVGGGMRDVAWPRAVTRCGGADRSARDVRRRRRQRDARVLRPASSTPRRSCRPRWGLGRPRRRRPVRNRTARARATPNPTSTPRPVPSGGPDPTRDSPDGARAKLRPAEPGEDLAHTGSDVGAAFWPALAAVTGGCDLGRRATACGAWARGVERTRTPCSCGSVFGRARGGEAPDHGLFTAGSREVSHTFADSPRTRGYARRSR